MSNNNSDIIFLTGGEVEHTIEFEGIQPDDDPQSGMVIMKGFRFFFGDDGAENYDKPPPYNSAMKRGRFGRKPSNLPSIVPEIKVTDTKDPEIMSNNNSLTVTSIADFNNQFTITSLGKVSILEGNFVHRASMFLERPNSLSFNQIRLITTL